MQNYVNVLCVNSWQVKRYIDLYSASSVIGFPSEDLLHLAEIYAEAQANLSNIVNSTFFFGEQTPCESCDSSLSILQMQIGAYSKFLASVAELARSKWTEFDLLMMGVGLGLLLASLLVQVFACRRANNLCQDFDPSIGSSVISLRFLSAPFLVAIRACSFLSNSYILAEGKVASFLLATTGILNLRYSIMKKKMLIEALTFLVLTFILSSNTDIGLSKQAVGSAFMNIYPFSMLGIGDGDSVWMIFTEIVPMLVLTSLAFVLYKSTVGNSNSRLSEEIVITGTILCYMLIALHWALESNMMAIPLVLYVIGKNFIPRVIYATGSGLLALLLFSHMFDQKERTSDYTGSIVLATVAMLCVWSSTVLILLGTQGPLVALMSIIGGWCIIRLQSLAQDTRNGTVKPLVTDPIPVAQWSFLSVCLFFYTGHRCAFDGLRYGAAFIGFDDFNLIRQGALLSVDTFGFSHILPILSLPFLTAIQCQFPSSGQKKGVISAKLMQVYLIYGFITAVTTTFTIICVTIQRRHLMVWGLFAPKYVFDVVGLILTDVLICFSSLYYF